MWPATLLFCGDARPRTAGPISHHPPHMPQQFTTRFLAKLSKTGFFAQPGFFDTPVASERVKRFFQLPALCSHILEPYPCKILTLLLASPVMAYGELCGSLDTRQRHLAWSSLPCLQEEPLLTSCSTVQPSKAMKTTGVSSSSRHGSTRCTAPGMFCCLLL